MQTNTYSNLSDRMISLSIALEMLLNEQEKSWGYFQIEKKNNDYQLNVPLFPKLRLYKDESKHIYKAYWLKGDNLQAEKISEVKMGNIAVYTRKKQRKVYLKEQYRIEKMQRIHEIVINHDSDLGFSVINKVLANLIKTRIEASISLYVLPDEVMAKAIVMEE